MMSTIKQLRDPIYGYINIPTDISKRIIDTSFFQRLRRVIQTSYSPLYSSSIHNRFIHSLGVFYLGQIAARTIVKQLKDKSIETHNVERIENVFLLACLLHDVGHAPFSHTGEKYYLDDTPINKYASLHSRLKDIVNSDEFSKDVPSDDSNSAAPHEIMSCIIGISSFGEFLDDTFSKEFFARCITGYKYSAIEKEKSLLNCFISLLNSKVIDVDRLDYLIRDAFFTGFDTVSIDYERLLTSLTIIERDIPDKNDEDFDITVYEVAYYKNAISVIENVVYAHDCERKWIQNHPVVLYEMYIIQHIINELNLKLNMSGQRLFSENTLGVEGVVFQDNIRISLLCDDDVIFLLKNILTDSLSKEYMERNHRRSPMWKSEAEYKSYLKNMLGSQSMSKIENALKDAEKYVRMNSDSWVINSQLIDKLKKEIDSLEDNVEGIPPRTRDKQLDKKKSIMKVFNSLNNYSKKHNEDCDYVLLNVSQFYSGFNKEDVKNINIVFKTNTGDVVDSFGEVVTLLSGEDKWRDDFFYIFHNKESNHEINKKEIFDYLIDQFIGIDK